MLNFIWHIPTKVYFGTGQIAALAGAVRAYGTRVMVVTYQRRSEAETQILQKALALMDQDGLTCTLFDQVEPNPLITTVERGAALCRTQSIQVLLAIGGGSA